MSITATSSLSSVHISFLIWYRLLWLHADHNQLEEGRVYLAYRLQTIIKGSQGRNPKQELGGRNRNRWNRKAAYCLVCMACSGCFIIQPKTTCQRVATIFRVLDPPILIMCQEKYLTDRLVWIIEFLNWGLFFMWVYFVSSRQKVVL